MATMIDKIRGLITPFDTLDSIYDITPGYLHKRDIKGLILDLDNTLISRGENLPSLQCLAWVDMLKESGIKVCIATNNADKDRVCQSASYLDIPAVCNVCKPMPYMLRKIMREILCLPAESVMIVGDQFLTDVIGGNALGIKTARTLPLGPETVFYRTWFVNFDKKIFDYLQ